MPKQPTTTIPADLGNSSRSTTWRAASWEGELAATWDVCSSLSLGSWASLQKGASPRIDICESYKEASGSLSPRCEGQNIGLRLGVWVERQGQINLFLGRDKVPNLVSLGYHRQSWCGLWHLPNVCLFSQKEMWYWMTKWGGCPRKNWRVDRWMNG